MTFENAAKLQYRYATYYAIILVGPNGERETLGKTQRKSGSGLLLVLERESVQARMREFPGAYSITLKKTASALILSNGWRIEFGGTIRQEAD